MSFSFGVLEFHIEEDKIYLTKCGNFKKVDEQKITSYGFVHLQLAGEHKNSHHGIKMSKSSEGDNLTYISHKIEQNTLKIVQRSSLAQVESTFIKYDDNNTIRSFTKVTNISDEVITLDEVSSFKCIGLGDIKDAKDMYLYKFYQGHHTECQPRKLSFFDLGLIRFAGVGSKRLYSGSVGSWSTKEELPQGIIEYDGGFTMFQIESNHSWYYEISDIGTQLYLYLGGPNVNFGNWSKNLAKGESYTTPCVALSFSHSLDGVIGEMTKYRRQIKGVCSADKDLPTIFNEYMHLSWDSPEAEATKKYAPIVSKMGIEYYVIDCGWHNEEPGNIIYPYVGQWKESNARFPEGVRKTTDYIRSLGMKAGLWIEPEVVGKDCLEMLEFYDDNCFITRNGKKVCTMGRYFLDFRNEKVREYMTQAISRMVEEYGADYIKMDYNEDLGSGTDYQSDSLGEGLEQSAKAFLDWIDVLREKYPLVIFETCASGGHRMDYLTLSKFPLVSTSDQTKYKWYPYIAGNVLSAVLPEQAAVWSYPVDGMEEGFEATFDWVDKNVSNEQVIMNMVNSFLGRMHLASHLELLSDEKQALVKEGVSYFKELSKAKESSLPCFPIGFTNFGDKFVASGFKTDDTIYLAVWNLGQKGEKTVALDKNILSAKVAYPACNKVKLKTKKNLIKMNFTEDYQARFLEIKV